MHVPNTEGQSLNLTPNNAQADRLVSLPLSFVPPRHMGPSASPAASGFPHPPHAGLFPKSPHQLASASLLRNSHVDTHSSISHDKFTQLLGRIYGIKHVIQFSSVTQSCPALCDPMDCSTPGLPVHSNSWSLLKLTCIESVMPSNHLILCCPFSSCPQSFPASGSFPMTQFFTSGGLSIGVSASASVLPRNIED